MGGTVGRIVGGVFGAANARRELFSVGTVYNNR